MIIGAAITAVAAAWVIAVAPKRGVLRIGDLRPITESHTRQVVRTASGASVQTAAWLWMAWKNKAGRRWARIVSTILFCVCCLDTSAGLVTGVLTFRIMDAVIWLVALAALIELWRPGARQHYQPHDHVTSRG